MQRDSQLLCILSYPESVIFVSTRYCFHSKEKERRKMTAASHVFVLVLYLLCQAERSHARSDQVPRTIQAFSPFELYSFLEGSKGTFQVSKLGAQGLRGWERDEGMCLMLGLITKLGRALLYAGTAR
ncbi:hypothetical protein M0804_011193 [Polistes exclamans]|nr:hypothetical protein M0804_011193 [Polistes exclamans]